MATFWDLNAEQWDELGRILAEERLEHVNAIVEDVHPADNFYVRHGKRAVDIVFSSAALAVTAPLNLVFGICTYFDVGRPILFVQKRVGKDGVLFKLVKFRNMTNEKGPNGELLPASERVTKFGKFMRQTSMDELLNFWSIFKGDMSVIGPRPLPALYLPRYNKRHRMRLAVRPGLECPPRSLDHYWSWQEQLENDVWYVENVSLKTDVMLFFKLIQYALDRKSSEARSEGDDRGTFFGYDWDGTAITEHEIPEELIERVARGQGTNECPAAVAES